MKICLMIFSLFFVGLVANGQSSKPLWVKMGVGFHHDIGLAKTEWGGVAGIGLDMSNKRNRWQVGLELSKFSERPDGENFNSFRGWSSSLQIGRIWKSGLKLNDQNIEIGGGLLGIINFHSRQDNLPGAGLYGRVLIPVYLSSSGERLHIVFEPSYFGDGLVRGVLGLNYRF